MLNRSGEVDFRTSNIVSPASGALKHDLLLNFPELNSKSSLELEKLVEQILKLWKGSSKTPNFGEILNLESK